MWWGIAKCFYVLFVCFCVSKLFRKKIKKIITDSDTITYNVEQNGFDKTYMDKGAKNNKFYEIIDQFNERKMTTIMFYSIFLNKIHLFFMMEVEKHVKYCLLMMKKLSKYSNDENSNEKNNNIP